MTGSESKTKNRETLKTQFIMKIGLLLLLFSTSVNCRGGQHPVPALDPSYLTNLYNEYLEEYQCLIRIDDILSSKWLQDLEKIPTNDLGALNPSREFVEPSKPMYNTKEQEWLMESGSSSNQIDSCIRNLIPEIVPSMNQRDINCLNSMFAHHIEEELVHEEIFVNMLKTSMRDQLPFRRFISFTQFVDMMFQSRTPDALGDLERTVYEHAESYLTTDKDRSERTYIIEQECEWKNARKLWEASGAEKFAEFERQVRDSVNQQLGSRLVKSWSLNSTLGSDKYAAWSRSRGDMESMIKSEIAMLKNQQMDAQSLCERATKFSYKLSDEQADILLTKDDSGISLRVTEVYEKARSIEKAMKGVKDFRHPVFKVIADKYETGTQCLTAFSHLVQNHRKFDMALGFVDGMYNYPEFFCKLKNINLGLIATRFCKCVGSFCVAHGLAALFAEEYTLVQSPDGTYRVVLSGLKSREKVHEWTRD